MKAQPEPASSTLTVDLAVAARELHGSEANASAAHGGRTLVRESDLRVVLIAMAMGAKLTEHHVKDTATIQVVEGKVSVGIGDRVVELGAGQLLPLGRGLAHDVEALERSTLLVTLAQLPG